MEKRPISEPRVLCEAYDYDKPVPFSRGTRIDIKGITILMISGTASVNEKGETVHPGDLEAQTRRTFFNISELLAAESATWKDVVRTTIFLKDMRDYEKLSTMRTDFFREVGVDEYPASTCVQAHLCRDELLVEIEAIAILESDQG